MLIRVRQTMVKSKIPKFQKLNIEVNTAVFERLLEPVFDLRIHSYICIRKYGFTPSNIMHFKCVMYMVLYFQI